MIADALKAYSGKRVLVTGHTGFKGAWLCAWLERLGAKTTGYALAPESRSLFRQARIGDRMDSREGDVRDLDELRRTVREAEPQIVFHMAAQSLVRPSYDFPVETFATNVMGTAHLLEAVRDAPSVKAVVSVTSDKCYENDGRAAPFRETDAMGGHDPYSASKGCAELVTSAYARSFFDNSSCTVASARAGNVIGGGDWAEDRLVPDLMRATFSGQPAMVRNPAAVRPWQHVLDVLAGYLIIGGGLLGGRREMAEAWNLGPASDAGVSVQDLLDAIRAQLPQLKVEIRPDDSGRHESVLLQLDSAKAMTRLGWRPRWESEMLERTIAWYRAFYESGRVISNDQLDAYQAAFG